MVFGWGKKKDVLEHEVEPIEQVISEIKLTEIPKIIDNIENLRQKTLVSEIKAVSYTHLTLPTILRV